MTVALAAFPAFYDNSGNPLAGGKIFTYAAGTLNPLATYTDRGGLTPNANPVILDSAGRCDIWLSTNVAYQLILQDSAGNVLDSVDNFYAGADPAQLSAAGIVPATGGTYTGLVSFTGGATFDGTAAQDLATLDSLNIAGVQSANLYGNPDCAINQRVATTAADGNAGFDRHIVLCETGSVTLSQLAQPVTGIPFAMRMTQPDAGPKRIGYTVIPEAKDVYGYRGQNMVFAAQVRCSAATTIRCALVAWTGTADAPTRDVVNNWASTNYTAGNFFIANTLTIAVAAQAVSAATWTELVVSSITAGGVIVPATANNLYLVVWSDAALAQNATLDVSLGRAGRGTVAPLWTPPIAALEMLRCQRDYAKSYALGIAPATSTSSGAASGSPAIGGSISATIRLPAAMRTTPTVRTWTTTGFASTWTAFTTGGVATAYAVSTVATDSGITFSSSIAAGEVWMTGHWDAATGF